MVSVRRVLVVVALVLAAGCSPSAAPSAGVTSTAPAPAGFAVLDSTWLDRLTGWALVGGPCGPAVCPSVRKTTDGGRSWSALADPPACASKQCVSHIRFAGLQIGYLFGPGLLLTTDGGRSWAAPPSPPVAALEVAGAGTVRVVADTVGCPPGCTYRAERAAPGASTWKALAAPPLAGVAASVAVDGDHTYVAVYGNPAAGAADQHTRLARSLDAGATWASFADPCGEGPDGEQDAVSVTAAPAGFLAALCEPRLGRGAPFVVTSTDAGATFGPRRPLPLAAPGAQLISAGSAQSIAVAFVDGRSKGVLSSVDAGATWRRTLEVPVVDGPQVGWSLRFSDALVVRASFGTNTIWSSADAGTTWERAEVGPL